MLLVAFALAFSPIAMPSCSLILSLPIATDVPEAELPPPNAKAPAPDADASRPAARLPSPELVLSFPIAMAPSESSSLASFSTVASSPIAIELVLRSEEHTSELQSRGHLVCRLLLEKKKNKAHAT